MAEENNEIFTYKLKKPVKHDGKTITELSFDFDKLTGDDALEIEHELLLTSKVSLGHPSFNSEYVIRFCARACSEQINSEFFRKLGFADYTIIMQKAKNFMLTGELL